MPKLLLLLPLVLFYEGIAYSQAEKDISKKLLLEAVRLLDGGDPDKAIHLLDSAKKNDPANYVYDYEIGFA